MTDEQYAVSRQLLELGKAVARLRAEAGLTRGELGKKLHVKASDIAVIEEETPRAPAGLLEAALHMLVNGITPNMRRQPESPFRLSGLGSCDLP